MAADMKPIDRSQIGLSLGYGKQDSVHEIASAISTAEDAGFDLSMFSETVFVMRDSVSALAAAAVATHRIQLGAVQVARLRTPLLMAQTLASLDELSDGRLVLAIGACTALHESVHGLAHADPVETLTDWVSALRLLLTGERTSFDGRHVSFRDVGLGWTPIRTAIPIYVAATSVTGLRLAGRIGDGLLLNSIASTSYTRNAVEIARDAAAESGRDPAALRVAQIINVSVDEDPALARDGVRWEIASKFTPRAYTASIPPRLRVGEPLIDPADVPALHAAFDRHGFEGLASAIPTSYLEGLTASGVPDAVLRRVAEYRAAGVDLPIVRPAQPAQTAAVLELFAGSAANPRAAGSVGPS
jgi:5,10-methylenetetrahydromethanopterin reductase